MATDAAFPWPPPGLHLLPDPDPDQPDGPQPNPDGTWGLYHPHGPTGYPALLPPSERRSVASPSASSPPPPSPPSSPSSASSSSPPPVRRITAAQYAALYAQFEQTEVPGHVVFPWLYGANHHISPPELAHLLRTGPQGVPPPRYRGMVTIRADVPAPGDTLYRTTVPRAFPPAATTSISSSIGRPPEEPVESVYSGSDLGPFLQRKGNSVDGPPPEEPRLHPSPSLASEEFAPSSSRDSLSAYSSLSNEARASFASTAPSMESASDTGAPANGAGKHSPPPPPKTSNADVEDQDQTISKHPLVSSSQEESPSDNFAHLPQALLCQPRGHAPKLDQGLLYEPQPAHSRLVGTFNARRLLYAPLQAGERELDVESNAGFLVAETTLDDAVICASAMDADPLQDTSEQDAFQARFQPICRPLKLDFSQQLRNFGGQFSLFSSISDVFIYCPTGLHSGMLELAQWVSQAQQAQRREIASVWGEQAADIEYQVFVVEDSFDAFERHFPSLVEVSGAGNARFSVDFDQTERDLLQALAQASEVAPGIWVGGPGDAPHEYLDDHGQIKVHNPDGYAVVIRAEAGLDTSDQSQLLRVTRDSEGLECQAEHALQVEALTENQEDVHDATKASSTPQAVTPENISEVCNQYCRALGPMRELHCAAPQARSMEVDRIVDLAMWMHYMAEPSSFPRNPVSPNLQSHRHTTKNNRKRPAMTSRKHSTTSRRSKQSQWSKKLLLYSNDGYMSVAPIMLTFLMYRYSLNLPQAIMYAHKEARRELHLYPNQLPLLRAIEARLHARLCTEPIPLRSSCMGFLPASVGATPTPIRSRSQANASTFPFPCHAVWPAAGIQDGGVDLHSSGSGEVDDCVHLRSASFTRTPLAEETELEGRWINHRSFTGSLASRILPQLYLGDAGHAMNVGMLRAQGITHVLSVGESPLAQSALEEVADFSSPDPDTLWGAYALDLIQLREVPSLQDDGLDSLRAVLPVTTEWLHNTIAEGGTVLVHCRAGVSRSVTVVMAYLMAHARMCLEDAYSFVRARRLAVLIQPTLLFFWELRDWQKFLMRKRGLGLGPDLGLGLGLSPRPSATDEIGPCDAHDAQEVQLHNSWLSLSALIARANARYGYCE